MNNETRECRCDDKLFVGGGGVPEIFGGFGLRGYLEGVESTDRRSVQFLLGI